jgi:hypothetical protein
MFVNRLLVCEIGHGIPFPFPFPSRRFTVSVAESKPGPFHSPGTGAV